MIGNCRDLKSYNKKRAKLRFASIEKLVSSWHIVGTDRSALSSSMHQVPILSFCFVVLKRCVWKLQDGLRELSRLYFAGKNKYKLLRIILSWGRANEGLSGSLRLSHNLLQLPSSYFQIDNQHVYISVKNVLTAELQGKTLSSKLPP